MPFKFNPFTGTFDQTGTSGGGGASYIDGEVANFAALPLDGTAALDSAWLVRTATNSWFGGGNKPAGIYIRTSTLGSSRDTDYTYAGTMPDVFSDANFTIYDNADTSKNLKFQLSGLSASTTSTLTVPNASGTLVLSNDARIAGIGSFDENSPLPQQIKTGSNGNGVGGYLDTRGSTNNGGFINTSAAGVGSGGYISTQGSDEGGNGGFIDTSAQGDGAGGNIITNNGGGSIDTRGTGSLQLGVTGTRTTLVGSAATTNKTITLPNATGTVALNETFAAPPAIGNTTRNTGAFTTLNATNGTITASAPVLDLSQTWNNAAVAFTSLKLNVTSTNSLSTSLLADFQLGGISQFKIDRTGNVTVPTSSGYTAGVGRWYDNGGGGFVASLSGSDKIRMLGSPDYFILSSTTELTWGSSGISSIDLRLTREAAGTIAQRNSTNAQTYRLYNTYTSGTTFERLNVRWASNELIIDAEKGSVGGTLRGIKLGSASTSLLGFYGATPAVQGAAVADATDAASVITRLNDLLARVRTLGLIAT